MKTDGKKNIGCKGFQGHSSVGVLCHGIRVREAKSSLISIPLRTLSLLLTTQGGKGAGVRLLNTFYSQFLDCLNANLNPTMKPPRSVKRSLIPNNNHHPLHLSRLKLLLTTCARSEALRYPPPPTVTDIDRKTNKKGEIQVQLDCLSEG